MTCTMDVDVSVFVSRSQVAPSHHQLMLSEMIVESGCTQQGQNVFNDLVHLSFTCCWPICVRAPTNGSNSPELAMCSAEAGLTSGGGFN